MPPSCLGREGGASEGLEAEELDLVSFWKGRSEGILNTKKRETARALLFALLVGMGVVLFSGAIVALLTVSKNKELYSHIPVIPFVSLYFLVARGKGIFTEAAWNPLKGFPVMACALVTLWLSACLEGQLHPQDYLSLMMTGLFLWLVGAFVFSYGAQASRRAAFPLLFLLFIIPIPTLILEPFIHSLQVGSTEFAHAVFKLTGVPLHRDGFLFSLPGLTIEVAEQCSGIRSSIALVITGILMAKLFLRKAGLRAVLILSVLPVTMFKNALRIVMLALLGAYVDPRFITGSWLHRSGGIPFFVVGLLLLLLVLWGLRKLERKPGQENR